MPTRLPLRPDRVRAEDRRQGGVALGLRQAAELVLQLPGDRLHPDELAAGVVRGDPQLLHQPASILYTQGAAGIDGWTGKVDDAGFAARQAAALTDNLRGDLERLGGSIETALINAGKSGSGILRELTQSATDAVNGFAGLPGPVQAAAVGLVAIGTGGAGAIAALGTLVPRVQAGRQALRDIGTAGERADRALGRVGKWAGIGTGALVGLETAGLLLKKLQDASFGAVPGVEEVKSSLLGLNVVDQLAGKLPTLGGDLEYLGAQVRRLADPSLGDQAAKVFTNVFTLGNADPGKLRGLVQSGHADQADQAFRQLADAAARGGASTEQLRKDLPGYRDALAGVGNAAGGATPPVSELQVAARDLGVTMTQNANAADVLASSIDALSGAAISATQADISYRDALAGVGESVKQNGHSTNLATNAGRRNTEAVLAAVAAASKHASAVAESTAATKGEAAGVAAGSKVFNDHVGALRRTLIQSGLTRAQVEALIRTYAKTPPKIKTETELKIAAAEAAAKRIQSKINAVHGKTVTIQVSQSGSVQAIQREINSVTGKAVSIQVGRVGFGPQARAEGGPVAAGQVYRINESGAEGYFVPPADGYVVNHRDFAAMLDARSLRPAPMPAAAAAGGGRPVISITVNPAPGMDEAALATRVAGRVNSLLGGQADLLYRSGTGG